jgi:hypothetical protein
MYRKAFPRCKIKGSLRPVPYGHFDFTGCIPKKCLKCKFNEEGDCTRALNQVSSSLALDYGPCEVDGDTSPELIAELHVPKIGVVVVPKNEVLDVPKIGKVYVPKKCLYCLYLAFDIVRNFYCNFEREKWGDFPRAVDWGNWNPSLPNVGLASRKNVSMDLIEAVNEGKETEAIKIFREINKGASIKEARDAFKELKGKLNNL